MVDRECYRDVRAERRLHRGRVRPVGDSRPSPTRSPPRTVGTGRTDWSPDSGRYGRGLMRVGSHRSATPRRPPEAGGLSQRLAGRRWSGRTGSSDRAVALALVAVGARGRGLDARCVQPATEPTGHVGPFHRREVAGATPEAGRPSTGRLLRVTQDDDDGVIGVDDDRVMRTAPLGVVSGAVVGVVTGCPSG